MKKKIIFLWCICFLALMGTAQAAVDNTSMYGTYVGTLTDGDGLRALTLTIGDDASLYNTSGDQFYIYVAPDSNNWNLSYSDEYGSTFYTASLTSDTSFRFTEGSPFWTTMGLVSFMDDMFTSFTLTGFSGGTDAEGKYVSSAITGSWTRATPIPGAIWLLGSGLIGLVGLRRKQSC